jgi:hypothetical protein
MITQNSMTILKPNKKHSSYNCYLPTGEITPMDNREKEAGLLHETTVWYQSASWLFGSGKMKR